MQQSASMRDGSAHVSVAPAMACRATLLLGMLHAALAANSIEHHRYVIVGAGPAGLQMSHYLRSAGRDHVLLERDEAPGAWFARMPRFRQLVSYNRPNSGVLHDLERHLRSDWHSLLCEPSHSGARAHTFRTPPLYPVNASVDDAHLEWAYGHSNSTSAHAIPVSRLGKLAFTARSALLHPKADAVQEYLAYYARQHASLPVRYNTFVMTIDTMQVKAGGSDVGGDASDARFMLTLQTLGEDGEPQVSRMSCTYLIMATGLSAIAQGWASNNASNMDLAYTYENFPVNQLHRFHNARVLILGRGNAAFELAANLLPVAAQVHIAGGKRRIRTALDTLYIGDVSAMFMDVLQTYRMHQGEVLVDTDLEHLQLVVDPVNSSRLYAVEWNSTIVLRAGKPPCAGCPFRKPYDAVISCPGFALDASAFSEHLSGRLAAATSVASGQRFPAMTARYEALAIPGMFFIGALAHVRDYRMASGGFINGMRHSVRALHRILEEEERVRAELALSGQIPTLQKPAGPPAKGWPRIPFGDVRQLAAAIMRRAYAASGLYHMHGQLVDVVLLSHDCELSHEGAPNGTDALLSDELLHGARSFPSHDLCGWLFEEVPVAAVPAFAHQWATELLLPHMANGEDARNASTLDYAYLTLSLEYGENNSREGLDHFEPDRASVPLEFPNMSQRLHPVLRYYDSRIYVPHLRPNTTQSASLRNQQARSGDGAAQPQGASDLIGGPSLTPDLGAHGKSRRTGPRSDQQALKQHSRYLVQQYSLTETALRVSEWTRAVPLHPSASEVISEAAAAASGPQRPDFITPVTTLHLREDALDEFDLPDRHVASLLRFLEHLSTARLQLELHLEDAEDDDSLVWLPYRTLRSDSVSSLVARLEEASDPFAHAVAALSFLPLYPVGYLRPVDLSHTRVPRALVSSILRRTGMDTPGLDAQDVAELPMDVLWTHEILTAVVDEHARRRGLFFHANEEFTITKFTPLLFSLMTNPGAATLYRSDLEMREWWYTQEQVQQGRASVLKVPSGSAWTSMLPTAIRIALLYKPPSNRVLVVLLHAGVADADGDAQDASSTESAVSTMLRLYALRYPELAFIEVNLRGKVADPSQKSWQDMTRDYDGAYAPADGVAPQMVADYLGIVPSEIPCLVVVTARTLQPVGTSLADDKYVEYVQGLFANADNQRDAYEEFRRSQHTIGAGARMVPGEMQYSLGELSSAHRAIFERAISLRVFLEVHTVPLAGRTPKYLDGALRARLLRAQDRANTTIQGLEGIEDSEGHDPATMLKHSSHVPDGVRSERRRQNSPAEEYERMQGKSPDAAARDQDRPVMDEYAVRADGGAARPVVPALSEELPEEDDADGWGLE